VVFIDDLDRCLPEKALELLESIKLFLDLEGYLFLLGVDREVVEQGINYHYRFYEKGSGKEEYKQEARTPKIRIISPTDYLDKMIQMPFELPPMEPILKRQFIETLLGESAYQNEAALIEAGIGENPRSLTRFVNFLAFMGRLAEKLKGKIPAEAEDPGRPKNFQELLDQYFTPHFYVKWAIIVFRFRPEHDKIKNTWKHLIDLQSSAGLRLDEIMSEDEQTKAKEKGVLLPEPLRNVLAMGNPFPEEPWLIRKFIHLAAAVKVAAAANTDQAEEKRAARPGQRTPPAIGDMVKIPRGPFLYGDYKKQANIDQDFEIDVYPVTDGQYREFIKAGGYREDQLWSKEGIAWRNANATEPEYWWHEKRNNDDYPVVDVSYYEAEAYAAWVGKRLPSEEEWEKAARGDNGLIYPWGDEFDPKKCNTTESGGKGPTPVTEYPDGASTYGCYDMAGNVWEWTKSNHPATIKAKVLRSGAWHDSRGFARCAYRNGKNPNYRTNDVGFRCARTVK